MLTRSHFDDFDDVAVVIGHQMAAPEDLQRCVAAGKKEQLVRIPILPVGGIILNDDGARLC